MLLWSCYHTHLCCLALITVYLISPPNITTVTLIDDLYNLGCCDKKKCSFLTAVCKELKSYFHIDIFKKYIKIKMYGLDFCV